MHSAKFPWLLGLDDLYSIRNDALSYYQQLQKTYGDTVKVRIGPYVCWFLFHPDHIEQVLAKQADKFIRFEKIMNVLKQWNGESLLVAEGISWKQRRRKVLPAFKQQRMPKYAEMIASYVLEAVKELEANLDQSGEYTCDIDAMMAQYALDIAGITLFSKRLGSNLTNASQEAMHKLSEIAYRETTSPIVLPKIIPTPLNLSKASVVSTMKETIRKIVMGRLSETGAHEDLLTMLMEHHQNDQKAIEEDVMSLLIAGHETSGATLTWLFIMLGKHPELLAEIHKEIDTKLGAKTPKYDDLKDLAYLKAALQEVLRLYPAAYALLCRRAINNVDFGEFNIPRGHLVQILPYVTQRDERWFEKAEQFDPSRFMEEGNVPYYSYFPFGAGPRVCIGQSFAMMEIMLTVAIILKTVTIKPIDDEITASPRFSLRPKGKVSVTFCRRNNVER